jgi:hypothetical protein
MADGHFFEIVIAKTLADAGKCKNVIENGLDMGLESLETMAFLRNC